MSKEQIAKIIGKYPFGLAVLPLVIQLAAELNKEAHNAAVRKCAETVPTENPDVSVTRHNILKNLIP